VFFDHFNTAQFLDQLDTDAKLIYYNAFKAIQLILKKGPALQPALFSKTPIVIIEDQVINRTVL
jgi:hypothetical protein